MRIAAARAAAPFLALLAGLAAVPAHAADPAVTMTLTQRWQSTGSQGTWVPYTAQIKNDGTSDFTGDLFLVPNESVRQASPGTWPVYHQHAMVQKGATKDYTLFVVQAPAGYRAELHDTAGRPVADADLDPGSGAGYTIAVLSDQHQAESKIAGYKPIGTFPLSASRFASALAFPTNAVYLSGLNAVLIDDFDTGSLSQAQVQALRDFVGFGGSLIVAGGPTWRRTLLPLPPELSPLHPTASATASLQPLAELAGTSTDQVAQIATGDVHGQVVLGAPGGPPLTVTSRYGAGEVIELAYDPLAEPFDTTAPALGSVAWSQVLTRALLTQPTSGRGFAPGPAAQKALGGGAGSSVAAAPTNGGGPGVGVPTTASDQILGVLGDTPVAALPPVGLLGILLVSYALLAGPLNYLLLKALRRRELMWLTVPAVSIAFTASAYGLGFVSRGSDFVLNEVQIQRLAPDGAVETTTFSGIYSPRKGDYTVSFPTNTLVSTAVASNGVYGDSQSLIQVGVRPQVDIHGAPVWSMRVVQSLAVGHQPAGLESHLALNGSRLTGTVTNRGPGALGTVWAVTGLGGQAQLAAGLPAGGTVEVDQDLTGSSTPSGVRGGLPATPVPASDGSMTTDTKRIQVMRAAAAQAVTSNPLDIALVALTEPTRSLQVQGAHLTRYVIAAVVAPGHLDRVDAIATAPPQARLVSTTEPVVPSYVDVYDLAVPPGITGQVLLAYSQLNATQASPKPTGQGGTKSVEVYDWTSGAWRTLQPPAPNSPTEITSQGTTAVSTGEMSTGIVRVRVRESGAGAALGSLQLRDAPGRRSTVGGS